MLLAASAGHAADSPLHDQNDANRQGDAPDDMETAWFVDSGKVDGELERPFDVRDWYAFHVEKGQGVTLRATRASVAYYRPADDYHLAWEMPVDSELDDTDQKGGTWYVQVPASTGQVRERYSFWFNITDKVPQNDAGCGGDAGHPSLSDCGRVPVASGPHDGYLDRYDRRDLYTIAAPGRSIVEVTMQSDLTVFSSIALDVDRDSTSEAHAAGEFPLTVTVLVDEPEIVELRISLANGWVDGRYLDSGNYSILVDVRDPTPEDLSRNLAVTNLVEEWEDARTGPSPALSNGTASERTFTATIQNLGEGNVSRLFFINAGVWRGPVPDEWDEAHIDWYQWRIEGLDSQESIDVTFSLKSLSVGSPPLVGETTLVVWADTYDHVIESSHEDNIRTLAVHWHEI